MCLLCRQVFEAPLQKWRSVDGREEAGVAPHPLRTNLLVELFMEIRQTFHRGEDTPGGGRPQI